MFSKVLPDLLSLWRVPTPPSDGTAAVFVSDSGVDSNKTLNWKGWEGMAAE